MSNHFKFIFCYYLNKNVQPSLKIITAFIAWTRSWASPERKLAALVQHRSTVLFHCVIDFQIDIWNFIQSLQMLNFIPSLKNVGSSSRPRRKVLSECCSLIDYPGENIFDSTFEFANPDTLRVQPRIPDKSKQQKADEAAASEGCKKIIYCN